MARLTFAEDDVRRGEIKVARRYRVVLPNSLSMEIREVFTGLNLPESE